MRPHPPAGGYGGGVLPPSLLSWILGMSYSVINGLVDTILPGSHNPAGIPGLEIPQSRIPGLRKRVRDWNP